MEVKHIASGGLSPDLKEQALNIWNQVYPVNITHDDMSSFQELTWTALDQQKTWCDRR